MADEYIHNPQDPTEVIFEKLETQVVDIYRNRNLLMVVLLSKIKPMGDYGVSNLDIISEVKSGDWGYQGNESQKESEKEQSISSVINPS